MKELYESTFNKIALSTEKENQILEDIIYATDRTTHKLYKKPLMALAMVASFMFVIMMIPSTRAGIIKAAEYLQKIFTSADGSKIIVEESNSSNSVSVDSSAIEPNKYMEVCNDKVYFVLEEVRIDITDKCSENTYFRYDFQDEAGVTHIIFVGGEVGDLGWAEFIFDRNGTYITNLMSVSENCRWLYHAEVSIGVPTGDYNTDFPD